VSSLEEIKRFRKMFKEDVYEYNELVYSKNDTLIIIRTNEKITKIIKKKQVDKNKNRKYVIHVVEMSEADSFENLIQFLDLFNYKFINKTEVKEHLFTSENFYVSVSKEITGFSGLRDPPQKSNFSFFKKKFYTSHKRSTHLRDPPFGQIKKNQ
jgi:hypothetical protein